MLSAMKRIRKNVGYKRPLESSGDLYLHTLLVFHQFHRVLTPALRIQLSGRQCYLRSHGVCWPSENVLGCFFPWNGWFSTKRMLSLISLRGFQRTAAKPQRALFVAVSGKGYAYLTSGSIGLSACVLGVKHVLFWCTKPVSVQARRFAILFTLLCVSG